jgi:hypothetical protein
LDGLINGKFNLKVFLQGAVCDFLCASDKGRGSENIINIVISYYFEDFDQRFEISDKSCPQKIADVLCDYVAESYSSSCWIDAEKAIYAHLKENKVEKLPLWKCIEIIDGCCRISGK